MFDPILGRTYNELGGEARSMHKCQGMSQLLPLPAPTGGGGPFGGGPGGVRAYRLRDTVLDGGVARSEREIFDGVDTSLRSLLRFAGANAPADLGARLDGIAATVVEARKALAAGGTADAAAPLARGLKAIRDLRSALTAIDQASRYEIDFRLAQKEDQFEQALLLAADVRLEAIARDGLVPAGHPVNVQLIAARRGNVPVTVSMNTNGLTPTRPEDTKACSGELTTRRQPRDVHACAERACGCAGDGRAFPQRSSRRALRVRSGRAVRVAVPPDAVHRHVHPHDREHAAGRHDSDPGAIGRRHLQR